MRGSLAAALGLGLVAGACQSIEPTPDVSALEQDLDEMLSWFPGVYDNFEQIEAERTADLAEALDRLMESTGLDFGRFDLRVPGGEDRERGVQQTDQVWPGGRLEHST